MRNPRRSRLAWLSLVVLTLVAWGGLTQHPRVRTIADASPTIASLAATATHRFPATPTDAIPAASPGHVFLIIMENRDATSILGNSDAPYINQLAARYAIADEYYAIRHPSLPNYLALIGGDTFGVDADCTTCFQSAPNLVDALEAKGKTWKSYQEDMPQSCFLGADAAMYALKHNPFLYFTDIRIDPARCSRVVPLTQFDADLASGQVPDFVWITPNLVHDMHDGTIADGDQWLATFGPRILQSDAWKQGGELLVVWDEGEGDEGRYGVAAGGRVPLLIITPDGPPGYHVATPLTHYSLLRTIEDRWNLARIGHSGDPDIGLLPDLTRSGDP